MSRPAKFKDNLIYIYQLNKISAGVYSASFNALSENALSSFHAGFQLSVEGEFSAYISEVSDSGEEGELKKLELKLSEWDAGGYYAEFDHELISTSCSRVIFFLETKYDSDESLIQCWLNGTMSGTTNDQEPQPEPEPEKPSMKSIKIDSSMSIARIIEQHNNLHDDVSALYAKLI